jgi:hypothetical protein
VPSHHCRCWYAQPKVVRCSQLPSCWACSSMHRLRMQRCSTSASAGCTSSPAHGFMLQGNIWKRAGWAAMDDLRKRLEELKELRDLVRSLGR